jgi:hypothetical protein
MATLIIVGLVCFVAGCCFGVLLGAILGDER